MFSTFPISYKTRAFVSDGNINLRKALISNTVSIQELLKMDVDILPCDLSPRTFPVLLWSARIK